MDSKERRILAVTCFGHFMAHFNMLVFPPLVLPLARRLGLEMGQALELSFWMYLLFGVSALPWGLAADRMGAKPMMMLFFGGAGLCGLGAAFSLDTPLAFSLWLGGIGLFSGIYHPAGLGLIARGVQNTAMGMAYNGMFGNLGLAAAPLVTGLVYWLWGPVACYLVLAGLNLAGVGLMALTAVSEPPRPVGREARRAGGLVVPFLILLWAMMLGGFAYRGATVTVPAYFELKTPAIMHWLAQIGAGALSGNLVATMLTSFIFLLGMLAQYSGGWLGSRIDPRWGYFIYHAISIPAVFLMAWTSDVPLVLLTLVYLFFLLGMQPMENTLVARLSPPAFKHSAYGAKFVLTFGIGSLSVMVVGAVERAWGLEQVYTLLGFVTLVLVASIGLLIWRTRGMAVR